MSEQDQDQDPLLGQLVSQRYRVLRKIGEGGMGTVYEAEHIAIEKRIALKVLRREFSSSPTVVARFKQEAISASRIKHQNVIDVFDFGQLDDGACYIAMEYLEGHDLGDLLHQGKVFSPPRAVAIAVAVCRALALSHARGVVHRDLKPENIFLQRTPEGDECVKLVDFGIAQLRKPDEPEPTADKRRRRLTKTGMIFGTPEYMAPEQARGQSVDERSDIYAMGVILYELISGAVPFAGDTVLEVLNAHNTRAVPALATVNTKVSISPELWRVIARALEKEPDDRFASMGDFCDALLRCPEGRGLGPGPVLPRTPDPAPSDDPVRIENSSYPAAGPGKDTAVFGSPAQERELETALPLGWRVPRWVGAALGLALLAGGGAWMWNRVSPGGSVSPEVVTGPTPSAHTPAPAPSASHAARARAEYGSDEKDEPGTNAAGTGAPTGESGDEAPKARSVLHVSSEPPGAVIELDGFQVCDSAPCDVVVEPGQAVVLTAHKGSARAETKVLAQRSQTVTMLLESPKTPSGKRPAVRPPPRVSPGGALCEVLVDGIKILRPCE